jgi:hypothetical protein
VTDPEMMLALAERHRAMEERGRTLAIQAIESRAQWMQRLGAVPSDSVRRSLWLREVSTIAAYRDRWHIPRERGIGNQSEVGSTEQVVQRQRASCGHRS